jgi:hypothetical protein
MRMVGIAAGIVLAVCFVAPSFAAPANNSNTTTTTRPNATTQKRKPVAAKPTWSDCFNMSIDRGFNHEVDEWQQSIQDCMEGKIPLR